MNRESIWSLSRSAILVATVAVDSNFMTVVHVEVMLASRIFCCRAAAHGSSSVQGMNTAGKGWVCEECCSFYYFMSPAV